MTIGSGTRIRSAASVRLRSAQFGSRRLPALAVHFKPPLFQTEDIMIWILWLPMTLGAPGVFPLVDPGLFVISGVRTCGGGAGYCLLGLDCTLDEDFIPDDAAGQHCEGLRSAFTPSAHFVCCRAAKSTLADQNLNVNQSNPLTTPRTTTLDVLDNQIDQVLLKVAESINAAKKTPSTEYPQVTDVMGPEFELRESAEEASSSQESSLQDQLMADSPEINSSHEVIENKMSPEVIIQGNMKNREDIAENEHKKNEKIPPKNSVTILTESSSQESNSKDKTSEENVVLSSDSSNENMSDESDSEEMYKTTAGSSDATTEKENSNLDHTNDINRVNNLTENEIVIDSRKNASQPPWLSNSPNLTKPVDNSEDQSLSKVIPLQNDTNSVNKSPEVEIKGNQSVIETATQIKKSEVDDLNSIVTPKPDLSVDQVTAQNEQSNDTEWIDIQINRTTKRPIIEKVAEPQPEIIKSPTNTTPNEIVKRDPLPSDKSKTDDDVTSAIKKLDVPPIGYAKDQNTLSLGTNDILVKAENSTNGDGLVPNSSVSPANGSAGAMSSAPDHDQGRPGVPAPAAGAVVPCAARAANRDSAICSVEVEFVFQKKTLCFGGVYSTDWIVTSASCALRIFRAGMINVNILPSPSGSQSEIKTIIVHEAYAESAGTTGQQIEANNIGLVQLRTPVVDWSACVSCLPEAGQDLSGHNCTAAAAHPCATPGSCRIRRRAEWRCEGVARQLEDDHGFPFLTLACDTLWAPRQAPDSTEAGGSGAPLQCDGVLAGVQATQGMGLTVYTPLAPYTRWLASNTRPGTPEQTFNLGR